MKRTLLLCTILCSTVISCSRFDEAAPSGSGGAGGVGGAAGSGLGGMTTHPELCGMVVTCRDGVLDGMWGDSCAHLSGYCGHGCRVSSAGTADRSVDPLQFAQTLCVSPDAGDAGADNAGEDADPPDDVSDTAEDGG